MYSLEQNGWKITRRIGVGQRERIRAGLLQVVCLHNEQAELQVEGTLEAANKLQKQGRIYLNCDRMSPTLIGKLIAQTMSVYRNHDFMEELVITRSRFDWVLGRADIVIEQVGENRKDLFEVILKLWQETNGRDFLNGATFDHTAAELKITHPELFVSDDLYWQQYSKK